MIIGSLSMIPVMLTAQQQERPNTDTLPAVQITVLRTPFDLIAAPFSIAVVSSRDALAAKPGRSLDELLGRLAGVQADNRFNFALGDRISMRGLGARSQFGVRGVRVVVDGIPATLADGQTTLNNADLGSLGHAEVLRGPASALYGNASGGVILLETATPAESGFAPSIRALSGSYGLRSLQLGAEGQRGNATYLVTGDRLDQRGYRTFSDARNAHLNGVVTYTAGQTQWKVVLNSERHNAHNPGGLTDSLRNLDPRQAAATNISHVTGERGTQTQTGVTLRTPLLHGELRASGYVLGRTLDNPIPTSVIALHRRAGGWRAAYGVTTEKGPSAVTAILGVESDIQRDNRQNYSNVHGVADTLSLDQREHVVSTSPFVEVKFARDRFSAFGGLRYDHFRFTADDRLITPSNPDDSGTRHMSALSPSVGVTYLLARTATLYGNVATAFQTPTTTELANRPSGAGGFNPSLTPEYVHSRELGLRGALGATATYHFDVYQMRVTGELVPYEVPSSPGRQFFRNVGVAEHRGIEAEGSLRLLPALAMRGAYSYTDATVVRDTAPVRGDRPLPGVARHLATWGLDAGDHDALFASVELRTQSRIPVNDANTVSSPGYTVANVRARLPYRAASAIFGGITNLFDVRYNSSVVINAAGSRYFEPGEARSVYIGLEWHPFHT